MTGQWTPTGKVTRIDVVDGGSGYTSKPKITVDGVEASVKVKNGAVTKIQYKGDGIGSQSTIVIDPPTERDGTLAKAAVVLEQSLEGCSISEAGNGYPAEKPLTLYLAPKEKLATSSFKELKDSKVLVEVGKAIVASERSSYSSFRKDEQADSDTVISGLSLIHISEPTRPY